jgi:hypothetical protein
VVEVDDSQWRLWRDYFSAQDRDQRPARREICRIEVDDPERMEIVVRTESAGILLVSDLFDDDWVVSLHNKDQKQLAMPLWRANRIMRGVPLGPGSHRVIFRYLPKRFVIGAVLSLITFVVLVIVSIARWKIAGEGGSFSDTRPCLPP